ncbi:CARDB domain-containing protein [Natranaeroarchaeum sulfidigenes]|uniref:CARDB domain-containing protein n=1 Tax=Natranaeroarchaeum sulfidigenes TaxID=2784880 RepID=A0A897MNU4_9EURY|nr:CARDB domain-containing protein [Natranaeroarchaeum sulfidigenes]QSG01608.1 hypothetical protein AArcS_0379 [Natranaeroarchaeum sulfidigenes]
MTETDNILTDFKEAIKADDREQTANLLDELDTAFEEAELTERQLSAQSRSVRRNRPLEPAQAETLATYDGTLSSVELTRGALLTAGSMYVADPDEVPATEVIKAIDQLREFNGALNEQSNDVEQVLTAMDVPASLVVSTSTDGGPYLKGQKVTVSLTIENAGNEPATSVFVKADSQASPEPEQFDIGNLEAGNEITEPVTIQFEKAQETTVVFEVTDEDGANAEEELLFTVNDKKALAEGALEIVATVRDQIRDDDSITGGLENSLVSQLEASENSLQRALDEIKDKHSRQANNALNTATQQLGAFLNNFEARQNGRSSLKDSKAFSITTRIEGAIENAANAKKAEI